MYSKMAQTHKNAFNSISFMEHLSDDSGSGNVQHPNVAFPTGPKLRGEVISSLGSGCRYPTSHHGTFLVYPNSDAVFAIRSHPIYPAQGQCPVITGGIYSLQVLAAYRYRYPIH